MTAPTHIEHTSSPSTARTLTARELRQSILSDLSIAADTYAFSGKTRKQAAMRAQSFAGTLVQVNRERWLS